MTDRSSAGAAAAVTAVAGAEALFSTELALIRLAGYPIAKGFWTERPPHEQHLLDLAGQFHTAQASLRLIRLGRAVLSFATVVGPPHCQSVDHRRQVVHRENMFQICLGPVTATATPTSGHAELRMFVRRWDTR